MGFARVALLVPAGLLLLPLPAAGAVEYPGPVEDYATYQPETHCRDRPRAGTRELAGWMTDSLDGGSAEATMRACTASSSEHQDGRAIDWAMDAATKADRREVRRFLSALLATDPDGEEHALARRMGIMYLIWNDHIYSAYGSPHFERRDYLSGSCPSVDRCSKTLRHRDHVHLSLSRPGGRGETTWYRRTGGQ